jgi:hypothetical protein
MENYQVGMRIILLDVDTQNKSSNINKSGIVVDKDDNYVYVRYDDGLRGKSNNPSRYYKIISSQSDVKSCGEVKTVMLTDIKNFVKNSLLSADEKAMREVGFKDSCGNYTSEARDFVINALCEDKQADLIKVAKAILAEKKAK